MRAIMNPLSLILTTSNSLFTSKNNDAGTHVISAIPNSATPNSPPCISSGDRRVLLVTHPYRFAFEPRQIEGCD
ncbi:hypothetical protein FOQG_08402 [Fusarium oxysporum f. sp. raphani 54005]|uniref:Uncharacterized protein n=6 Tax=Fusarium oxysporum TaxID=5507 RepID=W9IZ06_FUSOX|nr:hypothetical protein FOYG_02531 [Fusarium oxysporum NRRL 32931]EWZ43844.1 hypothetical protein FOZG_04868 [Fusarium oxysporum Fo47]EWZ99288.1 hypothetical protein FOWG_03016 [Fusarium oxysporum f. sp. lycopersici MN25]EXA49116.1 hypothetical protein FOVG_02399 [Fusarium oxysporum f. sp. pisi HDV247]EXK88619.1 hypothetical protein FOQG_08402 [Fusarium oxysporum f. sp. raphani 54005]EXL61172.1 hypothetical protein FOCG_00371 [Fusarium oxysporum f. sp. radicis-lycopersici 26381]